MAQITLKTDVKINGNAVGVGDIKVTFNAMSVTEPITVPQQGMATYVLPYPGQSPFMLAVLPQTDPNNPPLRDGDLQYAITNKKDQATPISANQLFFNNSISALGNSAPTKLWFFNNTNYPIKVQIVAGFDASKEASVSPPPPPPPPAAPTTAQPTAGGR